MTRTRDVAVIIASVDAGIDSRARLARFAEEVSCRGEVLVIDASPDSCGEASARGLRDVRVVKRPQGMLAPHLWRDGLNATESRYVAFSTTSMSPEIGWLESLIKQIEDSKAAGVGGPILPDDSLNATDRAIYLLRYLNYFKAMNGELEHKSISHRFAIVNRFDSHCSPPLHGGEQNRVVSGRTDPEPPGDNALYRRESLHPFQELIAKGFWEVDIHRALRSQGERLSMSDNGYVIYQGGSRFTATIHQRIRHAMIYGGSRGSLMSPIEKLARTLASPLVPLLLLRRIAGQLHSKNLGWESWLPAFPFLSILATAWAWGEAVGIWCPSDRTTRNEATLRTQPEIV